MTLLTRDIRLGDVIFTYRTVNEQKKRANLFTRAMGAVTGNRNHALAERPFFVFWFMGQFSRWVEGFLPSCTRNFRSVLIFLIGM